MEFVETNLLLLKAILNFALHVNKPRKILSKKFSFPVALHLGYF